MNIGFYGHSNIAYTGAGSYINIVADHFGAPIANIGAKQGSEERILYDLKKSKQLDLAIIVHSYASCLFLPTFSRDISIAGLGNKRLNYLANNEEGFDNVAALNEALITYKQYFYNAELNVNRFLGAANQIVQYVDAMGINTIHITDKARFPAWFSYGKGIVNVNDIVNDFQKYEQKLPFFCNCISPLGNEIVARKLIDILKPLV